jgi:hypothetical protein
MPPNGKRETWDKAVMVQAIHCVRSGEMGYLKASKYFQIPKRTLE